MDDMLVVKIRQPSDDVEHDDSNLVCGCVEDKGVNEFTKEPEDS